MKSVNIHFLTRIRDPYGISLLLQAMSGRGSMKTVSPHEAATLWSFADSAAAYLRRNRVDSTRDWISLLDGFFFSFTIEHIGKEFDLLKVSGDGACILNIELKSEQVGEEKITRQLEQNRYYLSHIARMIFSFTYVMETGQLYVLAKGGELRECGMKDVAKALMREEFRDYLCEGIENRFQAAQYLISPIAEPEKFLKGKYFLTNQQFDFRRKMIAFLENEGSADGKAPVISVSGIAGTGKTLLLLDVALELSGKGNVLFIHSGPLRKGHVTLDRKLKGIDIISGSRRVMRNVFSGYGYVMIDEADHLGEAVLEAVVTACARDCIPIILTYDPHRLLAEKGIMIPGGQETSGTEERFARISTLSLAFSGNIRINSPVYSFLRMLLNPKDHPADSDYGCIDVLYVNNRHEQKIYEGYYRQRGYVLVSMSGLAEKEDDIIAREYDRVIMVLDEDYYYDESMRLRVRRKEEDAIRLLYEGLSRTREKLCLLIVGNRDLFMQVLSIRNSGRRLPV